MNSTAYRNNNEHMCFLCKTGQVESSKLSTPDINMGSKSSKMTHYTARVLLATCGMHTCITLSMVYPP